MKMSTIVPPTNSSRFIEQSSPQQSNLGRDKNTLYPHLQNSPQRNTAPQTGHAKRRSITSNPNTLNSNIPILNCEHNYSAANFNSASTADSFNTSFLNTPDQSDQYSTFVEHSEFDFDQLLTPECSENHLSEYTTPQEAIWEQHFQPQDTIQPRILNESQQTPFNGAHDIPSPSDILQDLIPLAAEQSSFKFVTSSQLISPRLTSSTSPEPIPRIYPSYQIGTAIPATMNLNRMRDAEPLQVSTSQNTLSPQTTRNTYPGTSPIMRAVSPVVIVSSHTRGDSPHRSMFARPRSSSKRSRDGDFQYSQSPKGGSSPLLSPMQVANDDNISHLMPPDIYAVPEPLEQPQDRSGLGPAERNDQEVPSVNELEELRRIDSKNADVETWLATSETGSVAGEEEPIVRSRRTVSKSHRPRAHSTGVPVDTLGLPLFSDKNIPGPGVLIDVQSEDDYSENDANSATSSQMVESPPVMEEQLNNLQSAQDYFGEQISANVSPEQEEPLPRQFMRRAPWQDPFKGGIISDVHGQPASSNAAMMRWNQEATKWENSSRAATWGTRRRLSDSEVGSIVEGSRVRHQSLVKPGRDRAASIITRARNLIPRRSNSKLKKLPESSTIEKSPERPAQTHRASVNSIKPVQRISSFGKSKSPLLDTNSAFMAMTGHLTAVGQSTGQTTPMKTEPESARSPLQMFRKYRSKSDAGRKPQSAISNTLVTAHGTSGSLLDPPQQELEMGSKSQQKMIDDEDDDEDNDFGNDAGIKMDFNAHVDSIIPTYEGFKINARQLNPRLEPYMLERIGQEQVRRYKKLIESKVKHTRAVVITQKCPSAGFCPNLGGQPKLLIPRASARDPDTTCAQFQVSSAIEENFDQQNFNEGIVTPALFPAGIPLPPVNRLPAEFECPLCFKVKKFQKPSDWTKHVHEDVQPFSCTFPNCSEPKSFKRKADWVRHENERHRRLESWKCNIQDCIHECFRKDNFVQHLVREHKMVEPKVKTRGSGSSKAKPPQGNPWELSAREQEEREFWQLIESCRHETTIQPQDEPCKFCGNVCNSWKKLSVHMGKHMEFIAMPVLELVAAKEVKHDTIVSPIEQNYQQHHPLSSSTAMAATAADLTFSPYVLGAHHTFQNSSTGHSPAIEYITPNAGQNLFAQSSFSIQDHPNVTHGHNVQNGFFANTEQYSGLEQYAANNTTMAGSFMPIHSRMEGFPTTPQSGQFQAPQIQSSIARSVPMGEEYGPSQTRSNPSYQITPQSMTYNPSHEASPFTQQASPAHGQQYTYQQPHVDGAVERIQRLELSPHDLPTQYMFDAQHHGFNPNTYQY